MSSEAPSIRLFFREAIARALAEEMQLDPNVIVLGQDVGPFGGSYKEFAGLYEQFGPERVRDTPVSESGIIGLGVGAAAAFALWKCRIRQFTRSAFLYEET